MNLTAGFAWRIAIAAALPALIVALLSWRAPPADATATTARADTALALDTTAVRAAAMSMATRAAAAARITNVASAAAPAPLAAPADRTQERMQALGVLTERIYAARDKRRSEGKSGAELRKPFTADELGGASLVSALGLGAARLVILRDGKVLAPVGGSLPEGVTFDNDKAHAVEKTASGVTALRYCPYGEPTCLIDISPRTAAGAAAGGAAAAVPAPPPGDTDTALDPSELDRALAQLSPPAGAPAGNLPVRAAAGPRVPAPLSLAIGLAVAFALVIVGVRYANIVAASIVSASARLMQLAAGQAPALASGRRERELIALHQAIDAAARGVAGASDRAALDATRRDRIDAVAQALVRAASARDLTVRVPANASDDAGLLAVSDGANRLIESVDRAVLRWQSHAQAVSPPQKNAAALEQRADALKPLPGLLADVAERLARIAAVPGLPGTTPEELRKLAAALGERSKTARGLVDALLLDLATERPSGRQEGALALLQKELLEVKTSATAPDRVAALQDLAPEEIGERVAGTGA